MSVTPVFAAAQPGVIGFALRLDGVEAELADKPCPAIGSSFESPTLGDAWAVAAGAEFLFHSFFILT
jgi:hypothetical protein